MDSIRIQGGVPLRGSIPISGAKNAALPLMAASLLSEEPLRLTNLPHLADIATMANLLAQHGTSLHFAGDAAQDGHQGRVLELRTADIRSTTAPYDLVRKMRASVLVLGPLLAREGVARVSLPGGCAIGTRPVDLHLRGLAAMGAQIDLKDGYIEASVRGRLRGARIEMPMVSVGATENLLMAASLADGVTHIVGAAQEPEITDLADCLIRMGAMIEGVGSDVLTITGVQKLHAATHRIIPDRIEAGTFALAAAITGGEVFLADARAAHLGALLAAMHDAGCGIHEETDGIRVKAAAGKARPISIATAPFPEFATDLQAQWLAYMGLADGVSEISETIFENRFMHVPELLRMGAKIEVHGAVARVTGVKAYKGAPVMATDLRASSSLILAGLAAEGETVLSRVYHLDRGYERIEEKLSQCGARIERHRG